MEKKVNNILGNGLNFKGLPWIEDNQMSNRNKQQQGFVY